MCNDLSILKLKNIRRESQNKITTKLWTYVQNGSTLPTLPSTQVWTKISLDKYSSVYPTYLSKKFGHFGNEVCY